MHTYKLLLIVALASSLTLCVTGSSTPVTGTDLPKTSKKDRPVAALPTLGPNTGGAAGNTLLTVGDAEARQTKKSRNPSKQGEKSSESSQSEDETAAVQLPPPVPQAVHDHGHRIVIEQKALFSMYPPKYTNAKKKALFATIPNGMLTRMAFAKANARTIVPTAMSPNTRPPLRVAQYKDMPIPKQLVDHNVNIAISKDFYSYAESGGGKFDIWVNFADQLLFGFYHGDLFAQDEVQTTEMPGLAAALEMLKSIKSDDITAMTVFKGKPTSKPTPITVLNVERWFSIDTSGGLYGRLYSVKPDQFIAKSKLQNPPQVVHILAIAAEGYGPTGHPYSIGTIRYTFDTAYTGFMQAKLEAQDAAGGQQVHVVIHSGNWGCGAFGGNLVLMGLVQMLAARAAGVDLHLHAGPDWPNLSSAAQHEKAKVHLEEIWPKDSSKSTEEVFAAVEALKLKWGAGKNT